MREKPDVPDETLSACLRDEFGLSTSEVVFLPIGNDVDTAVYRIVADDATAYFLKLRSRRRSGQFDRASVTIPRFLHEHGVAQIIAPIPTRDERLWADLHEFSVVLSPFVEGRNGFEQPLSERQWAEFGAALRVIHRVVALPPMAGAQITRESYAPYWRDRVRQMLAQVDEAEYADPIAAQLAAFLREKREVISCMVGRADALGHILRTIPPAHVLCHADIHAANVLLTVDGALYIVDWDTPIFAPKERDLMFIGGGVGGAWNTDREETLFYRGYGKTDINLVALAYYRYERIVEDIAEYSERLLHSDEGREDRAMSLGKFRSQFGPNGVVEIAQRTDRV